MRRAELQVGGEYYYDRSPNWMTTLYTGSKAIVVSDEPWRIIRNSFTADRITKAPSGNGVLVDIHDPGQPPHRTVVQASQLRGPWEETSRKVDKWRRARQEKAHQEHEERNRQHRLRDIYMVQANALGLNVTPDLNDPNRLTITTNDLSTYLSSITH